MTDRLFDLDTTPGPPRSFWADPDPTIPRRHTWPTPPRQPRGLGDLDERHAHVRTDATPESRAAAQLVAPRSGTMRRQVLDAIVDREPLGATTTNYRPPSTSPTTVRHRGGWSSSGWGGSSAAAREAAP